MFSWAKLKQWRLETPGEQLIAKGESTAARSTSFIIENRGLLLDCGNPSDYRPGIIVLTHMHLDHVAAIPRYLLNVEQNGGPGPIIICPAGSVAWLRNYIESTFRLTKRSSLTEPIFLPNHTIIGATIGPTNCSVIVDITCHSAHTVGFESTTIINTPLPKKKISTGKNKKASSRDEASDSKSADEVESNVCDEMLNSQSTRSVELKVSGISDADKIKAMKKPHRIEAIRCNHGGQPTTGYGFIEIRERMKEMYLTVDEHGKRSCKLTHEELREMKVAGTIGDLKETVEIPLFAYVCDTDHKVFQSNDHHEGYKLEKYPVIIIECTFFELCDKTKAKKDKHMHWDNLKSYISANPDKYFKLIHFSNRYSESDLDKFQRMITSDFPTPKDDNAHVVMFRNISDDAHKESHVDSVDSAHCSSCCDLSNDFDRLSALMRQTCAQMTSAGMTSEAKEIEDQLDTMCYSCH